MASPAAAVRQEAAYYQAIEEFFVSRRGDPLLLSNADWTLMRRWRQAGVPLRVVLRGIADAFDARAHSWARDRKVGSLRYCEAEVDGAYERWQRALAGGNTPEESRGLCARLGAALGAAAARLGGALGDRVARVAAQLADAPEAGPALEAWLRAREDELLAALREQLGEARTRALAGEVEAELQPYRERLPARVLAQVRDESLRRRLLDERGLPRLTLFEA